MNNFKMRSIELSNVCERSNHAELNRKSKKIAPLPRFFYSEKYAHWRLDLIHPRPAGLHTSHDDKQSRRETAWVQVVLEEAGWIFRRRNARSSGVSIRVGSSARNGEPSGGERRRCAMWRNRQSRRCDAHFDRLILMAIGFTIKYYESGVISARLDVMEAPPKRFYQKCSKQSVHSRILKYFMLPFLAHGIVIDLHRN